jgi:hypothetical protein
LQPQPFRRFEDDGQGFEMWQIWVQGELSDGLSLKDPTV